MNVQSIKKWSITSKSILAALAVFLISIWLLFLYTHQMLHTDMERLLMEQQFSTVSLVAADIDAEIDERLLALKTASGKISPAVLGNASSMQAYIENLPTLTSMFNAGLYVTGSDGTAIASLPLSVGRTGVNYLEQKHVAEALKSGKVSISQPRIGKQLKTPVFAMAMPIRDAYNKVIGALVGVIELDKPNFLDKITDNSYGKSGGYIIVAPQQRLIVTATDKKRIMETLPPPGVSPFIDRAIEGYEGSGVFVNPQGVEVLVSTKTIPVAGWYVAAILPTEEAFAPITAVHQRLLLAALLVTLLAGGMTWWFLKVRLTNESLEQQMAERLEDLERVNRLKQFRSTLLEMLGGETSLTGILEAIVRGVEQLHPAMMCSILLLDSQGRHLGSAIGPSLPAFYNAAIEGLEIGPGVGSCGTAAFTGERVVVDDITTHPFWAPYKNIAADAGLAACWSQPIHSSSGQVLGTFAIYHHEACSPSEAEIDIIEQSANLAGLAIDKSAASNLLRESDELLTQFMLHSPIHTFVQSVTPTESRTLKCSDSFQKMLGLPSRDMIGKTMQELFPQELAAKITTDNWAIVSSGKAVELEEELHGRYYITIKFPIVQRDRTLLAGYTIDVTERTQAEKMMREFNDALEQRVEERTAELQASEVRFKQLAEQSGTIFWEIDTAGLITYIDPVCEAVYGYHPDEVIGRMHFYEMNPDPEAETFKKTAFATMARQESLLHLEHSVQAKDGHIVWVSTSGIPILGENGTLRGYRGSDTDITESKKLEEQLRQSQKMEAVGQLAGGLAHDFNNVLSVINGYSCLIQMEVEQNETLTGYLDKILAASGRAGDLTRSMLAFSRTQVMNPKHQDLNGVVAHTSAFIEKIIHENISLKTAITASTLPVYVDCGQIEQILINLANNARDAMPTGGELYIATDSIAITDSFISAHGFGRTGRYAVITVSDTGTGMDEATRKKVFEPFFTTKAVDKGTGLGLAMVYGIVKQHQGYVDVASELGHGASFIVYLPMAETETAADGEKADAGLALSAGTETILVAEDNADLLEFMRKVLLKFGYQVICAVDGQDAVDKFRDNADKIQLIIMDMIMPNKSGKVAYDEIKQIKPHARALFSSGYSANIIHQQGELGENALFISKPVQPSVLLKHVRELLDR